MPISRRVLAIGGALALACGVLAWWLWPGGGGLVEETLALQTRLLSGDVGGRDLRTGVRQVVRNVDRMDRAGVRRVQNALAERCRELQRVGIEEYFTADKAAREELLDRDIARLVIAGELWFASNPQSSGQPPRRRPPKPPAGKPAEPSPDLKMFDSYRTALEARAAKTGVKVPVWLLRPPRA